MKDTPKLFFGYWQPTVPFSVKMIPHCFNNAEFRVLGRIHPSIKPVAPNKVQNIRQAVGTSAAGSAYVPYPPKTSLNTMRLFQPINSKDLEDILHKLNSSSCCLDILPTGFFKGVSKILESDLLLIVNLSLISSVFLEPLKTAVSKPLLKKDNLDKTQMNNYRPISNLPF